MIFYQAIQMYSEWLNITSNPDAAAYMANLAYNYDFEDKPAPFDLAEEWQELYNLLHTYMAPCFLVDLQLKMYACDVAARRLPDPDKLYATNTNKTAYHSGKIGDVIYSLPFLRYLQCGILLLDAGKYWTAEQRDDMVDFLKATTNLKVAKYVKGSFQVDLSKFRDKEGQYDIPTAYCLTSQIDPGVKVDLSPWLSVKRPVANACVIHRTLHHQCDKIDWGWLAKEFSIIHFIGTPEEHAKMPIATKHIKTNTLLEFARVVAGAKVFICNQSSGQAICEALGKRYYFEPPKTFAWKPYYAINLEALSRK